MVFLHINAAYRWGVVYPLIFSPIVNSVIYAVPIFMFIAGYKYKINELNYNYERLVFVKIKKF